MWLKLKRLGCYLIIIILLPYIITVFLNGPQAAEVSGVDETCVNVKDDVGTVEVTLKEYCIGILAKEIPVSYELEALKAQAILVRTAIYMKLENGGTDIVLEESYWTKEDMQEAWGASKYADYYDKLEEVWEDTEGQVVTYDGKLAKTAFFRLSNGSTRDGKEVLGSDEYPYLKIVECPLDIESTAQIQTMTIDDMDAEITASDTAGYVMTVRVGSETISGEAFRTTYNLASSCFTLQKYNGKLRITTRGVGHGLGMSQYTAQEMAKSGESAENILQYFFGGTEIKEVTEIVRINE